MFSGLKKILSRKALSKFARSRENRKFVDWDGATRVQFLYCAEVNVPNDAVPLVAELYKIQSLCKEDGKIPFFVLYSSVPVDCSTLDKVLNITKKDCGRLTSCPRKETLAEFGGYEADLLINLSTAACTPLEYYASASAARFKAGSVRNNIEDSAGYDFLIAGSEENPVNSPLAIFKAIRYYLQMIKPA